MRSIIKALAAVATVLVLTACNSSSDGDSMSSSADNDAFIAQVKTFIRSAPNDVEPADVERIVATQPDTTEPVAVN